MECKICQSGWAISPTFGTCSFIIASKLDDRSAESIDKFWSIDRELIKQEALLLQQCVMSYLEPNPLLFSDTLL